MAHERITRARTPASTLATKLERTAALTRAGAYPLTFYQMVPVRYAKERLHVDLMPHQVQILRALCAGILGKAVPRVAVRSGQKCGKTLAGIVGALWFYECFPSSRVFLCAAIEQQTKLVLWRELGSVLRFAKASGALIDGKASASPSGGLISSDGSREIRGLHGRDIESLAGLSGSQLMIVDEASALPEAKSQVFAGNQLGGGASAILLISNPTRTSGPFYDAFHSASEHWQTAHIDGEAVADWQAETGRRIPFTITREKIEEARDRFGEKSPFFLLRVKGEFLRNETGRCITIAVIEDAIERWSATDSGDGPLVIGYDPAGPATGGDLHAWAPVRGNRCGEILTAEGLSIERAFARTLELLRVLRRPRELPRVHVDAEGPIGSVIVARLRDEAERRAIHDRANAFLVVGIKSSSLRVRQASKFERLRDEMMWALAEWMVTGAIPADDRLQNELHASRWSALPDERLKCTPKDDLRDILGRSPDRMDALCLAVQPSASDVYDEAPQERHGMPNAYGAEDERDPDLVYGGSGADLVYGGARADTVYGVRGRGGDDDE